MKITYKDGSQEDFETNEWDAENSPDGTILIIKRKFDKEGEYDEDDDKVIAIINVNEFRSIKLE